MGSPQEYDRGRRWLITRAPLAIGFLLVPGCIKDVLMEKPATPPQKEKDAPRAGDIIIVRNQPYLLRNERRYQIPDLERYKRNTKFGQYGRRLFSSTGEDFEGYPLGNVPQAPAIIDPFTSEVKANKPFGGEINVYFAGLLTDGGTPYEIIRPRQDTFVDLRKGLEAKNWDKNQNRLDSVFFTYGQKAITNGLAEYQAKHTARQPEENIEHALNFIQIFKEQFPLDQFNLIAHSLGTIFALEIARKHYDAINNLILISGPVRGFRKTIARSIEVEIFRRLIMPLVGDEKVTDYLFRRWEDKNFQRDLEKFVAFFTSIGRRITVIIDESDPIVPVESASIEGAEEIRIAKVGERISIEDYLKAHGRPLRVKGVTTEIAERIGENLALAG